MPPVQSFCTTLSGVFRYWPFTHGSTSAVQPWALWQNPVGIPGSEIGPPSPQPLRYPVAFPEGTSPSDGVSSNLLSPDPAGLNSDASRQIGQRLHAGASPQSAPTVPTHPCAPKGSYRAESLRRREPESIFSASAPLRETPPGPDPDRIPKQLPKMIMHSHPLDPLFNHPPEARKRKRPPNS